MIASDILDAPDVARVTSVALTWPAKARALVISDADSYLAAGELLKGIKSLRGEVNETFDPIISANFKAHRTSWDKKKQADTPLAEAEAIIKDAMVRWDDAQERLRREQLRIAEETERRRIEEDRINLAAHMETEGKAFGDDALVAEAEHLISQPIVPIVPAIPRATPMVSGQHFTTTWSAQVVSLIDLVKFVAANPSHVGLLTPNTAALNGQARSLKEHLRIPGVRPVPTKNVVSRRA